MADAEESAVHECAPQEKDSLSPTRDANTETFEEKLEPPSLSHPEVLQRARELTHQLLSDPFLQDLPPDISLDELRSQLALEQGKAITLHLRRYHSEVICKEYFIGMLL